MTIAQIQKIAADAVANALRLTAAKDAPAVAVAPKPAGRRTLTPEQKAKMAEGRKRAAAAKTATAPAAAAPVAVAKPAKVRKPAEAWSVKDHVTKKGVAGKVITVGPFSAWLPNGDAAKRKAVMDAINNVFRAACIEDVVAQF